jgi:hypothetical protein
MIKANLAVLHRNGKVGMPAQMAPHSLNERSDYFAGPLAVKYRNEIVNPFAVITLWGRQIAEMMERLGFEPIR